MKERPDSTVEEDSEEMKRWRSLNQIEIDLCWKSLAGRMEEKVLNKYKVEESKEEGAFKGRGKPLEWKKSAQKQDIQNWKVGRRLLGETFLLV